MGMKGTAVVLGWAELISGIALAVTGLETLRNVPYLLDGSWPLYFCERYSGSYLTSFADAGSLLAKLVSSRSWASWVAGASVEAYRGHGVLEIWEMGPACVLKRLKNEAVTSCSAIPMQCLYPNQSRHIPSMKFTRRTGVSGRRKTL